MPYYITTNHTGEVSTTMLISELPKYICMEDEKGLWVNLFVPSEIKTDKLSLEMETGFPDGCDAALYVKEPDGSARICIHIPSWAAGDTEIFVNGEPAGTGASGTYVEPEREWKSGDTITFTHQMGLTAVEYEGRDAAPNGLCPNSYRKKAGNCISSLRDSRVCVLYRTMRSNRKHSVVIRLFRDMTDEIFLSVLCILCYTDTMISGNEI